MKIPDHLVDHVRELAEEDLKRARGDVLVIGALPGVHHEHAQRAHERLRRARELAALFDRPGQAAA